ncbi:hypothetical protein J0H58_39205 [bacterium]|nr:hypothetical protein [bacterium]
MRTSRTAGLLVVGVLAGLAWAVPPAAPRFGPGHRLEGLPVSDAPAPVYAADPGHWLNELSALLFTWTQVPEEVGGALPGEHPAVDFYVKGWQFKKRKGGAADRATFGGDVRVSAVVSVDAARRAKLLPALDRLSTPEKVAAVPELRAPLARLLLQWDVLSLWWRLESDQKWKAGDPELLAAMARTVKALALPRAALERLPAGTDGLLEQFAGKDAPRSPAEPYLPPDMLRPAGSAWVEVDRKATKLFRGDVALRASRVYLRAGTRAAGVEVVEAAARADRPNIPDGTEVGVVMTLIGFDPDLTPVATPVVDEVRVRRLTGPFRLAADNPTSSHDGVDHWIYYRSRAGTLLGGAPFRFVPDTAQALFLEYGSAKHTTFAAQCALCHRAEVNTPSIPRGISVLNPHNRPRVATDPAARDRAAVAEISPVAERLRARAGE